MLRWVIGTGLALATIAGVLAGGLWCWTGFVAIVLAYPLAERLAGEDRSVPDRGTLWHEFSLFMAVPLFAAILFVNLWMLSGVRPDPGDWLGFGAAVREIGGYDLLATREGMGVLAYAGMLLSFSVTISLVCLSRAHEMVHRIASPASVFLGNGLYGFGFDGSYAIEHVYGHHADVGTFEDPVTARRGETLGQFFLRSTLGQYRNGWNRETARLRRQGRSAWTLRNRVLVGHAFTAGYILLGFAVAGLVGGLLNLALMLHVKWNAETSNYVQHYGLVRVPGTPIETRHSWDCRARLSSIVTINLTRHADHHVNAHQPYWRLVSSETGPVMPYGFLLTQLAAGQPALWRRATAPRLDSWDQMLATPEERALVAAPRGRPGAMMSLFSRRKPARLVLAEEGGERILAADRRRSILEILDDGGIAHRSNCRIGSCGTCVMRIVSGEVRNLSDPTYVLSADERARGHFLPCQARIRSETLTIARIA